MPHTATSVLPDTLCYLNGDYTPLKDAKISVMDRGFIFGDGVYEVVPAYAGQLFRFAHHMARLDRSLAELRIDNPLTHAEWREVAMQLIAARTRQISAAAPNDGSKEPQNARQPDQIIYIQVSRGVALRDHVMPPGLKPTVFVMVNAMKLPSAQQRSQGVSCVTADDFRWGKAHIKSTSLLGAVFSRQISADAGALETIMFRGDYLSEAAASNVWVVKGGTVIGPLRDNLVLEGIRYGLFEELCRANSIPFELRRITRAEVLDADELLLSSATKEVLPVTLLDGNKVGTGANVGQPGPVYAKLYAAYQEAKQQAEEPAP
jgi:D-alanine transaminase